MSSRMDRYNEEPKETSSRVTKNQVKYEEVINSNYTEYADVATNVLDLSNTKVSGRREEYHRNREFGGVINNSIEKKNLKEKNYDLIQPKVSNFDINSVLAEAKKNRSADESEKKRKLRTSEEYDILSNLTQEKIDSFKDRKKEKYNEDLVSEDGDLLSAVSVSYLNNTSSNLFDDLMPSELDETIVTSELADELSQELSRELTGIADLEITFEHTSTSFESDLDNDESDEEVIEKDDDNEVTDSSMELDGKLDHTFYTRSMDLSDSDLLSEEAVSFGEYKKEKKSKVLIIFLVLILLAIFGIIGYCLINGVM